MSKKRAAFLTLGCKVNQYETDAMEEILEKNGYEIVGFKEIADVYIINTCSVTNMADRKSRQMIHRAKKNNVMYRLRKKSWRRKMRQIFLSEIIKRKKSHRF